MVKSFVWNTFFHSAGLGSDLTSLMSLNIYSQGIHFEASHKNDLTDLLNSCYILEDELARQSG